MSAQRRRDPRSHTPVTSITPLVSLIFGIPLGAIAVIGFEPVGLSFAVVIALALLFRHWVLARTPRTAFFAGYGFGLGFFLVGVSWIYVSLHTFGAMPMPLAALATLLFCAFLALFPALAGYATAAAPRSAPVKLALIAPALWMLIEWTRGWIFTGFPWLAVGYSQAPGGALAGYAPIAGVYGVSLAVALSAGGLALLSLSQANRIRRGESEPAALRRLFFSRESLPVLWIVACLALLWLASASLKKMEWTRPTGIATSVPMPTPDMPSSLAYRGTRG